MDGNGYCPLPLGLSQQQSSQNSPGFYSQTNNAIPLEIRRKIQSMLLFKHSAIGCLVSCLQDEYKVCYDEDISPDMFGYSSWLEMCKAMSDEVTIETVRRHPVVVANTLTYSLTKDYLGRIFGRPSASPSASVSASASANSTTCSQNNSMGNRSLSNGFQCGYQNQSGSGSQLYQDSSQSERSPVHRQNRHSHCRSRSTDADELDGSNKNNDFSFNSDSAITGNDLSQVQVDSVSSHHVPDPKKLDRTRKNLIGYPHQGQGSSAASTATTTNLQTQFFQSSHDQFQFPPIPPRTALLSSESEELPSYIPLIDLSDEMDDDSDFSTVPVDTKHVVSNISAVTSHSTSVSGRAVPDKDYATSTSSISNSDSNVKRGDVSPNSKKRRILSGSSPSVAMSVASASMASVPLFGNLSCSVPNPVVFTNAHLNPACSLIADPAVNTTFNTRTSTATSSLALDGAGNNYCPSPSAQYPVDLTSTQLNLNTVARDANNRTNIRDKGKFSPLNRTKSTTSSAFPSSAASNLAAVVPDSVANNADDDMQMQMDVDVKPDLNALSSSNAGQQQAVQQADEKPDVTRFSISVADNIFAPQSPEISDRDIKPDIITVSHNTPSPTSQNPILSQFQPLPTDDALPGPGSGTAAARVRSEVSSNSVGTPDRLEDSSSSGKTSQSISPMVKRIVSLSMNTSMEAFPSTYIPHASKPSPAFGSRAPNTNPLNSSSPSPPVFNLRSSVNRGKTTATSSATSASPSSSSAKSQSYSLPITPTDLSDDNTHRGTEQSQPPHLPPSLDPVFNHRAGVTTRSSSRGAMGGLQRSRSQEMNSIYESFLSIHSANRRGGAGRGRGRSLASSTVTSGQSASASADRLTDQGEQGPGGPAIKLKGIQVALKHYPPLHLRRGGGGGRRSDFNPEDMDDSESVIRLFAGKETSGTTNQATVNDASKSASESGEPIPGSSQTQSTSETVSNFFSSTTGRKIPKDDTGIRLNSVKWFTPDDLGSGSDSGRQYVTFKYTTARTTDVQRQSRERFLDQYASEMYAPNTSLQLLQKIRKNRNPKVMCFHPFWSLAPPNRANNGVHPILSSDTEVIPSLSFESVQLANLDADMGFELSNHGLLHDKLQFISSYGNFADYFCWTNPNKVRGMGLMPSDGSLKFVKCPGVSYENFQLFSDGEVDIFDPTTKRNFEEFISLSSSFAPHSHTQSQSSALSVYVDIFVADGMGYPGMKDRPQDLCLLQFLLALETVREGGIFVLKVEDTLTCFSVGLIYLMSRCFYQVSVHKPESALPGERFIVCRWKRADEHICEIKEYLSECNMFRIEDSWSETNLEIVRLFGDQCSAITLSAQDAPFLHYVREQNLEIAKLELGEFELMEEKYATNFQNPNRILLAQATIKRNNYLLSWNLSKSSSLLDQQGIASGSEIPIEIDGTVGNLTDVINGNSNNSNENSDNGSGSSENGIVTPPVESSSLSSTPAKLNFVSVLSNEHDTASTSKATERVVTDMMPESSSSAMDTNEEPTEFSDFVFLHELPPAKLPERKPEELAKSFYGFDKISFCAHIPESHHYFKIPHSPANPGEFLRAYQRDIKVLEEGLPDGIFVKGYEQRMDLFSAIILGPENTPYEGGIFVFDIKLPDRYPNVPPQFFFVSFTKHRMNPNLYAVDGKVCVSLLGTWQGSSRCELWCKKSTLLQVLVSIQGLILVSEPYFNEPGHKQVPGDVRILTAARFYNEQAVLLLVQSLLGMLEKPPLPWQFEITFILKTEIPKLIQRLEGWIQKVPDVPPPEFNLFPISQQIEITAFLSKLRGHHQKYCNI